MSKHTPGPWRIDAPHLVWAESAEEYVAITQVGDWETIPRKQMEANARLIAAAPDLLEALQSLVAMDDAGMGVDGWEQRFNAARAAIAKAEGKA